MAHVVRNLNIENLRSLAVALGLDPDARHIQRIVIEADFRELTVAVVSMAVDVTQHERLTEVIRRFTLIPKDLVTPDG